MRSISPHARTALLFARQGISGTRSDAILKVRENRQRGLNIIVLDEKDLRKIAAGTHPADVIEEKYDQLLLLA